MAVAITRQALRLAIVVDVHDEWDTEIDGRALECLKPDLVFFTGDFGDENVDAVSDISQLNMSKAAILGNHDCWWSAGITAGKGPHRNVEYGDAVQAQLDFPMWVTAERISPVWVLVWLVGDLDQAVEDTLDLHH
ncbi:unnamed protein product [Calypogeia fissa]